MEFWKNLPFINLYYDIRSVRGDLSGISGNLTNVRGDLSGISGAFTGIRATVDEINEVLKCKEGWASE